ncbi:MAG: pyridoxine 5'-phosphate synthase [Bacteriovoracaceae bacterium]
MNKVYPRLGVNIDHVATLRQARGESYPHIERAAREVLKAGADQITIHLREDRRHIQDTDVEKVRVETNHAGKLFNFEMGCDLEILDLACAIKPDWVCLVPEKREERTTEGGLDLRNIDSRSKIEETTTRLKKQGIKVSLFVEADLEILKLSKEIGADAVEIHTGAYAIDYNNGNDTSHYLESFKKGFEYCSGNDLSYHAGHGLTDINLLPLLEQGLFKEYNIGHWIVAEAVFVGLPSVVSSLNSTIQNYQLNY